MEEEVKKPFFNLKIDRVKNGFILTVDGWERMGNITQDVYVFNTLEHLSEFISKLDNP